MPAQVIIDKFGIVRYSHYGHLMSDIPDNQVLIAILEHINRINGEGTQSSLENGLAMVN
jgi:hypothetical protein